MSSLPGAGIHRTVVAAPLLEGEPEEDDFGLYSYLLYAARPTDTEVNVAIFAELLSHPLTSEVRQVPHAVLALTTIPQNMDPGNFVLPQWWIAHYDFDRSLTMLRTQAVTGPGPFIISNRGPLGSATLKHPKIAILDLSAANSKESATAWVRHYVHSAENPENWVAHGAELILLRIEQHANKVGQLIKLLPNGDKLIGG